ncbi:MAG: gas vesicle protein GvpN [Candidatus Methanoperedens sp.]|nr:MAG: gas vesicle protein GvpN [Candidatus Methanoperedens sp.]
MKYKETHPRKVRGEAVHKTKDEKMEELTIKGTKLQVTMSMEEPEQHNSGGTELEAIEAAYLVPELDHFVDAPDVKKLGERIKLWLAAGYPVHLIGPTGCGKTSLAMHTANELGRPVVWINGDESVTTTDLIGGYSQIEQESLRDKYIHNVFKSSDILKADWIDNPLAIACKYGYTLVYNEFSRSKPAANNVLLSVFEEGILELPTKFGEERYIEVHPDFKAILTSNSIEYAGVHRPQDALLDRMVSIYMDYYSLDTEVKIVHAHTGLPTDDVKKIVSVIRSLREKLPDAQKPGTRACIMIGKGLAALNGSGNTNFEQLCIDVMATKTCSPLDLLEKQALVKESIMQLA